MSSKCHRRKKRRKTTTKRPFDLFHFQVLHFYYYSAFVYVWNYNNVLALVSQLNWIMQCSAVRRKLRNFAQKIMRTTFFNLLSWLSCTTRVTASHKRLNHLRISLELRSRWATSEYILRSRRKFMESTDKASVEHCQDKYRDFSTIYNGPQHPQTVKNGMASNRKTCRWRQQKPFRNIRFSCWRKTESISSHTFLFPFCSLSIFCTIMQLWRRHSARSSTQNLCGRNMFFFSLFLRRRITANVMVTATTRTHKQPASCIYIYWLVCVRCMHSFKHDLCLSYVVFCFSLCFVWLAYLCVWWSVSSAYVIFFENMYPQRRYHWLLIYKHNIQTRFVTNARFCNFRTCKEKPQFSESHKTEREVNTIVYCCGCCCWLSKFHLVTVPTPPSNAFINQICWMSDTSSGYENLRMNKSVCRVYEFQRTHSMCVLMVRLRLKTEIECHSIEMRACVCVIVCGWDDTNTQPAQ